MIENTNTLKNRSRRVEYFDSLRITATFFVVMIHTVYLYFNKVDVRSSDWAVFEIYDSLSRWAVPVFVMISGALFLERGKPAKEIYRKNLVRIIIAYIAWSFIYAAIFFVRSQNLKASLNCFIKGRYHMWFLVMLGGLYLVTPILRKIAEDKKLVRLFLVLGLVFAGIIPELTSVLHMIDTSVTQRLADYLKYYTNNAFIFLPMGFSCYYMLGYALNRYGISKKLEYLIYILGLSGLGVTIFATLSRSLSLNRPYTGFFNYTTLNVAAMAAAVFVLFKKHFNRSRGSSSRLTELKRALSKYSFGVYMVHVAIVELLTVTFRVDPLSFNPILSAPAICVSVTIISFIISAVINHIPVLKKYIV